MKSYDMNSGKDPIQHLPLSSTPLEALLQTWRAEYPNAGVLALLPENEKDNLHILQTCCRDQDIPLAGAIFPALLIDNEFHQEGVLLFRFLAAGLQSNNGSLRNRSILTFYCAGRRMHLGENSRQELSNLLAGTGAAHLAGALSLGEIGSTGESDYPMFHNATLVCTPWGTT